MELQSWAQAGNGGYRIFFKCLTITGVSLFGRDIHRDWRTVLKTAPRRVRIP